MGGDAEDDKRLFLESVDLIGSTTISGIFYGIAFSLYCLCAHFLYRSQTTKPFHRKYIIFSLIHASALIILATIYLALATRTIELSFIHNKNFPGGPVAHQEQVLSSQPILYLSIAASFLIGILTLGIQVRESAF